MARRGTTDGERLAVLETKVDEVQKSLDHITKVVDNIDSLYVRQHEFRFLQKIVYAAIGAVISVLVTLLVMFL